MVGVRVQSCKIVFLGGTSYLIVQTLLPQDVSSGLDVDVVK